MKKEKPAIFNKPKFILMFTALFVIILILTFFFGEGGFLEIMKAKKQIEEHEKRITELENEKKRLLEVIKGLKINPLDLEKTAREKLWLMKENEAVIVIIKKGDQKDAPAPDSKKKGRKDRP